MPSNRQFDETEDLTAVEFERKNFAALAWCTRYIAKHDFSSHAANPSS
jgi:hypothetical protein